LVLLELQVLLEQADLQVKWALQVRRDLLD